MHPVRHDLSVDVRNRIIPILNQRLADLLDLQMRYHQAHWNVKGPNFISLHELFDELVDQLNEPIDNVAERVSQLGGQVEGTLTVVAAKSILPEYPVATVRGSEHLAKLVDSASLLATKVRADIDATAEIGDALTADLLTGLGRDLDKQVWLLDSHLHG